MENYSFEVYCEFQSDAMISITNLATLKFREILGQDVLTHIETNSLMFEDGVIISDGFVIGILYWNWITVIVDQTYEYKLCIRIYTVKYLIFLAITWFAAGEILIIC